MPAFFTADNCDFTAAQRAWANNRVAALLADWDDPDGQDQDNVKNACDRANNDLPAHVA